MLIPLYWTVVASLQPEDEAFALPPHWIPQHVTFDAYRSVFSMMPFAQQFLNSVLVTAAIVVCSLVVAAVAAYPLARLEFRGRSGIFGVLLSAMMIPMQITVIPVYLLMRYLHLIDNRLSLVLTALVQVVSIFLLRQHFMTVPKEISEAALLDGAGHLRILLSIVLPSARPALSALAIFTAQQYWNDFFWPNLLLTSSDKLTLPVGVFSLQNQMQTGSPVIIFAAVSMIVVPLLVLFLFAQRKLTEGVAFVGASR
ncbi:carbohydrate ABC transporter permease [Streptomyces sp. NPDC051322]|uniref:carbohydrate ABC transporter permease n=1 Tax=Streptomyces sp. NPDC051322 TaxID=3154645 RepID=UPI00344C7B5A